MIGTRLGPYEITAKIGAGGMGEVYRARDTRLGREVAVKVLPEDFSRDPDRLRRFELEARSASALNHPNILTIHDVGNEGSQAYLVTELLEGASLREVLDRDGKISTGAALDWGAQITRGLAAAHARGIVHRDLKPENLFVCDDGRIKILDFGLAKLTLPANGESSVLEQATTLTEMTSEGKILGTVGYMAPEQVRGEAVDARADIFSFGCVLYEMLAGERAFHGPTALDTLSAILRSEPEKLGPAGLLASRPGLQRLIARCLAKDPRQRWQCAGDLAAELERLVSEPEPFALEASAVAARRRRWTAVMAVVSASILAGLVVGWILGRRESGPSTAPLTRFALEAPAGYTFADFSEGAPAVSPDGRSVAFLAGDAVRRYLWLKRFDGKEPRRLAGTEGAKFPFWSPDGSQIGFFTFGKLVRLELATGDRHVVCDTPYFSPGASWTDRGTILFASGVGRPILSVPALGGTPSAVSHIAKGEMLQAWPVALPRGKAFLYRTVSTVSGLSNPFRSRTMVHLKSGETRELQGLAGASRVELVRPDILVYVLGGRLLAQRFDPGTVRLSGRPVVLADPVLYLPGRGDAPFGASRNLVVYLDASEDTALVWMDRAGRRLAAVAKPGALWNLQLARDESTVIYDRLNLATGGIEIWRADTRRGDAVPLTRGPLWSYEPVVSPDGRRIVFASVRQGLPKLFIQSLAPGSEAQVLRPSLYWRIYPVDWTPDGKSVLFQYFPPTSQGWGVWRIDANGDSAPVPVISNAGWTTEARLSPTGDSIAFGSTLSGRFEIYVQSYPDGSDRIQVSPNGGFQPQWRGDGRELYFIGSDSYIYGVPIERKPRLDAGKPEKLFRVPVRGPLFGYHHYAAGRDGQRFLVSALTDSRGAPARVVMGWESLLERN